MVGGEARDPLAECGQHPGVLHSERDPGPRHLQLQRQQLVSFNTNIAAFFMTVSQGVFMYFIYFIMVI